MGRGGAGERLNCGTEHALEGVWRIERSKQGKDAREKVEMSAVCIMGKKVAHGVKNFERGYGSL